MTFFDEAMAAANKKLSAARLEIAVLHCIRDRVLLELKTLGIDLEKTSKVMFERTTEAFWLISKQFETERARAHKNVFVSLK